MSNEQRVTIRQEELRSMAARLRACAGELAQAGDKNVGAKRLSRFCDAAGESLAELLHEWLPHWPAVIDRESPLPFNPEDQR
jgi:hypothetical protein